MKLLATFFLVAVCLNASAATNTLAGKLALMVPHRPPDTNFVQHPVTNLTLGWKWVGPTNHDLVIYSSPSPRGPWNKIEAIVPAKDGRVTLRISYGRKFFFGMGYDPVTGLTSYYPPLRYFSQ